MKLFKTNYYVFFFVIYRDRDEPDFNESQSISIVYLSLVLLTIHLTQLVWDSCKNFDTLLWAGVNVHDTHTSLICNSRAR